MTCKARNGDDPPKNYNKPHVWVPGEYDGRPRESCLYCGRWKEDTVEGWDDITDGDIGVMGEGVKESYPNEGGVYEGN